MCKRSPQMNMKQLEALLQQVKACQDNYYDVMLLPELHDVVRAIKYVQSRQRATKRRSAHFKFLADERREMLR